VAHRPSAVASGLHHDQRTQRGEEPGALLVRVGGPRAEGPGRLKDHTVRLWYALADLEERVGNVPRARALFEQVRQFDAEFADVAERLAALS